LFKTLRNTVVIEEKLIC